MFICTFVFIRVYWCPPRFPCQMTLVSLNSNTTCVTSEAGTADPSGESELTPVLMGVVLFNVYFFAYYIANRCLSFFIWPLNWPVLRFATPNYPFGIFKFVLHVFSFGHYFDCQTSGCGFWWLLWYLSRIISIHDSQIQTFLVSTETNRGRR